MTLRISVLFDQFSGNEDDPEPYLFVADPNVRRKIRPDAIPAERLKPSIEAFGSHKAS